MLTIGITDSMGSEEKFQRYISWLMKSPVPVQCVTLSYERENIDAINSCNGILMTGGNDVEPSMYGGPNGHPKIAGVDRRRDEFEHRVLERSMHRGLPVLGICRGMQISNVYFGGSLIPDIEDAGYQSHSADNGVERTHVVRMDAENSLSSMLGVSQGEVNSCHHQAVDRPGKGLDILARSSDGIIESLGCDGKSQSPFLLFVQWHPERLPDFLNPFSAGILHAYISSCITKDS